MSETLCSMLFEVVLLNIYSMTKQPVKTLATIAHLVRAPYLLCASVMDMGSNHTQGDFFFASAFHL